MASCWRYSPLTLWLRGEHWGKRQLCLVLLFLEKKATPQKKGECSLPALLLVGKVKLSGMSLDGHLLDPFSLICFCLSNSVRNFQACLPLVSFFFSFPSRGGRTVCLLFEGRNNDLRIFSPCSSPVLREAWPFPAKAFYFHRCIAQEREVWLYWFGGCLFFPFLQYMNYWGGERPTEMIDAPFLAVPQAMTRSGSSWYWHWASPPHSSRGAVMV